MEKTAALFVAGFSPIDTTISPMELTLDPALHDAETALQSHGRGSLSVEGEFDGHEQQTMSTAAGASNEERDVLKDYNLAVERAQTWSGPSRFGFNAMLASPEYKNKLRLKPEKMERIIFFLTTADAKSREKDRTDAQAKYQSQFWTFQDGILYRKASRMDQPRRHVSAGEAFDILTAEHLHCGHLGRDKMLKLLETKYIGYTKDELMYVLEHCLVCSSKYIRGAAARRRENKQMALTVTETVESASEEVQRNDVYDRRAVPNLGSRSYIEY